MATPGTPIDDERYVSFETFRANGTGVKTPVWAAPSDGKLVIVTPGTSFKVKRLRANPKCRVAGCDTRGKVIRTPWHEASCRILDDAADIARAHAALRKKYGWQMVMLDFGAWIARRTAGRAFLEVTVAG